MAVEIFLVSVAFWVSLLIIYVLFNRRLARLEEKVVDLEKTRKKD